MLRVILCKLRLNKSAVFGILALAVFLSPQHALAQFTTASLGGIVRDSSARGNTRRDRQCSQREYGIHSGSRHGCQRRVPVSTAAHRNVRAQNRKAGVQRVRSRPDRPERGPVRQPCPHNSADRAGHRRSDGDRHSGAGHDANGDRHPDGRRAADCGTPSPRTAGRSG